MHIQSLSSPVRRRFHAYGVMPPPSVPAPEPIPPEMPGTPQPGPDWRPEDPAPDVIDPFPGSLVPVGDPPPQTVPAIATLH